MFDSHFRARFSRIEAKKLVSPDWILMSRVSWFLFKTQVLLSKCKQLTQFSQISTHECLSVPCMHDCQQPSSLLQLVRGMLCWFQCLKSSLVLELPRRFHPPLPPCGLDDEPHQPGWIQDRQGVHAHQQFTELREDVGWMGGRERGKDMPPSFLNVTDSRVTCRWSACQL